MRIKVYLLGVVLITCLPLSLLASPQKGMCKPAVPAFMEVRLNVPVRLSRLKAGDELDGKVTRNVYSGYSLLVPRDSRVLFTVSGMKRGPKEHHDLWPWPVRYFRPKYKRFPVVDFVDVSSLDGRKMRLPVSVVSVIDAIHMTAQTTSGKGSGKRARPTLQKTKWEEAGNGLSGLRLELVISDARPETGRVFTDVAEKATSNGATLSEIKTLSVGTEAKLALLRTLSASRSWPGEPFKAMLVTPLRLNSGVTLPEGTVFEGHVTHCVRPRWLSRSGSLNVEFTRLIMPTGEGLAIAASVAGVNVARGARIKVSSEGGLKAEGPGTARLLVDLGVGAGISKVSDDSFQLVAEALISTATDASTAGTARLIGFALTGLYLLTRHGQNVILPPYTTITIRLDRPLSRPSAENIGRYESLR